MSTAEARRKWNRRYRDGVSESFAPEPHPMAQRWEHLAPGGIALDAACGLGRGIASTGPSFRRIYAVDVSDAAIEQARAIWRDDPRIRWIVGDVTRLAWPERFFGLVCAFGFTDLPFFARVPRLLVPDGLFLYEGFARRQLQERPELNPAWTTTPAELRERFGGYRIVELEESDAPPFRVRMALVNAPA